MLRSVLHSAVPWCQTLVSDHTRRQALLCQFRLEAPYALSQTPHGATFSLQSLVTALPFSSNILLVRPRRSPSVRPRNYLLPRKQNSQNVSSQSAWVLERLSLTENQVLPYNPLISLARLDRTQK